jgi:regulator of sigma E protease
MLGTALDLLLVIIGFGAIVFVHELGHFVAAKWAGIRVLAFALGFGPAAASYRKGLGLRRGSSEREYQSLIDRGGGAGVSPTEYRLNWLPFGGYVKMLGQEDINPGAVSDAPDSYQNTPVWKRMIVISAGVVCNVIAAALLFVVVFMQGIRNEPPAIGYVTPGSPASRAQSAEAPELGLKPGDRVLSVNGRQARTFNDVVLASAMSRKGEPMHVVVEREGFRAPLEFQITPEAGTQSRLLEIGAAPPISARLMSGKTPEETSEIKRGLAASGLEGVAPGMTLTAVDGKPVRHGASDLMEAARASGGRPLHLEFRADDGQTASATIQPQADLQTAKVKTSADTVASIEHLAGLVPVMMVDGRVEPKQGLKPGDVFVRLDKVEYPSLQTGIGEIHRHRGRQIDVVVLRKGPDGQARQVRIDPSPTVQKIEEGQIGFRAAAAVESNLVALPPTALVDENGKNPRAPAAAAVITRPGTRITAVAGQEVRDFTQIRGGLVAATSKAANSGQGATVPLTIELPIGEGTERPTESVSLSLSPSDVRELRDLGWSIGQDVLSAFEQEEFVLRAEGPGFLARCGDAIRMGVSETQRVMLTTYVTFQRLFEGTVKVEHLKGPVGIAHMGTRIASRGIIWVLFFMALISVNLAVVNFLPLPIVDGGQFIFLVLEGIRGKPLSIQVQNVATIAGLVLIGTVFLIVTYHDIVSLFG